MADGAQNRVLQGRIVPTFFYYVVPSTVGLVAITTANLVDGMFVGNSVGSDALASITLMVPYFTLLIAIALMLAIGGSVRAGLYVGRGDITAASAVFSQVLLVTLAVNLIFALASVGFEDELLAILNAPERVQPLMLEYFGVIRWVLVIQLLTMVLYYFVRADGHPILATGALVCGAAINIALDAWFVYHLQWGLRGAAYATAIAQGVQFLVLSRYFLSRDRTLQLFWPGGKWREVLHAAYNGVSEFINEMSVGLIFLLLNGLLIARMGVDGVAAFSVVNYFIFLSVMLCYGIADALHLLVSQNHGAQQHERVRRFLYTALINAACLGAILIVALLNWQQALIDWFLDSDAAEIGHTATQLLLLIWPLFLVNGANIVFGSYLTALQKPRPSALIALSRNLMLPASLLVVFFYLLQHWQPRLLAIDGAFLVALPLAEWCTFALAVALYFQHNPSVKQRK